MADDTDYANCFVDLTLYRCRMDDSCSFAAKDELDFEEHAKDDHPIIQKSYKKITGEELLPGTVLLKCQLCEFLIADKEVDDIWKRHFTLARVRSSGRKPVLKHSNPYIASR